MAGDKGTRWELARVYGIAALAAAVALVLTYQFVDPAPPKRIRMATGHPDGAYNAFGEEYRSVLARHGIELELRNTSGSIENLSLLEPGEPGVEAAFVQGGTGGFARSGSLVSLASLYFEPVWVVFREGLAISRLTDLAGRRVAVGPQGSGTRTIALELLSDNGVGPSDLELSDLTGAEAVSAIQQGALDLLFVVGSAKSTNVRRAVLADGVELLSLARSKAYTRRHRFLSEVVVPEGVIDLERNVPGEDVTLVSPTATLVVREDVHPALMELLLEAATEIHGHGGLLEAPGEFPSPHFVDLPLSKTAKRYFESGPPFLRRTLPFWAATLIDRLLVMLLPLLAFVVPLFRFMPIVYRWRARSRIYRWYKELRPLEDRVRLGLAPEDVGEVLAHLERMESAVKQVSVPWSYMDELYQLRLHIDLVRGEVKRAVSPG
jgi:TRAP transporter TAXI family solute receptor